MYGILRAQEIFSAGSLYYSIGSVINTYNIYSQKDCIYSSIVLQLNVDEGHNSRTKRQNTLGATASNTLYLAYVASCTFWA